MGCYLKRPQLHRTVRLLRWFTQFQWAATSNALSYYPSRSVRSRRGMCFNGLLPQTPSATFLYSRFFADTLFQWAATSNALSYSICKLPKGESAKSFNGLLPQTPSATISFGFGLEHYLHRFNGLLPQTPSATGNAGWWQLELVGFNGLLPQTPSATFTSQNKQETKSQFQWAATSNALSYSINQLTIENLITVSMGCYLKRPQLRKQWTPPGVP